MIHHRNGIALNTLHDKAFDLGLITFDEDLRLKVISKCFWKVSARYLSISLGKSAPGCCTLYEAKAFRTEQTYSLRSTK